jgi:hypothetical protein
MPAVFCFEPTGFAVEWRGEQLQRHQVPWVDFWAIIRAIRSGPERFDVPTLETSTGFKRWKLHDVLRWLTSIGAVHRVNKGVYARTPAFDHLVVQGYCGCEADNLDDDATLEAFLPAG